jgi:hypothetical protein
LELKDAFFTIPSSPRLPIPLYFWVGRSHYEGKTIVYMDSTAPGI